jgi:hypothetical protein
MFRPHVFKAAVEVYGVTVPVLVYVLIVAVLV